MGVKNLAMSVRVNVDEVRVQQEIPIVEHLSRWSRACYSVLLVQYNAAVGCVCCKLKIMRGRNDCLTGTMQFVEEAGEPDSGSWV